jgi:hypothetical protein
VTTVEPIAVPEPYIETGGGECAGSCTGNCTGGCQFCCRWDCGIWTDFDFLLGRRRAIRFPPAATTSPQGTPAAQAGVLGLPTTTVIYPTEPVGEDARPGGRISVGMWLDPCHCWAIEGRYFGLADEQTRFDVTSNGNPILARPFFDVAGGAGPSSLLIAFPGVSSPGNITVATDSQILGGDALVRQLMCRWGCGRLDLLYGFQFARIDESMVISSVLTDADPANIIPDGTTLAITDNFATRNEYRAVTIGAAAQYDMGAWRLDVLGKFGLGNMQETVTISGLSVTDTPPPGSPNNVVPQGLLAQNVNLGTFAREEFCVSPELNVKLVYHVNSCVDVALGYTFIYWSNVAQPGDQIDPDLRAPPDRFEIEDSEAWVHAFTLGASFQF